MREIKKTDTEADAALKKKLHQMGISYYPEDQTFALKHDKKDRLSEIAHIRQLASSLNALADSLEDKGIDCNERLPADSDSDSHGNVEWLRSGFWMRGPVSDGQPIDATRWRCIPT